MLAMEVEQNTQSHTEAQEIARIFKDYKPHHDLNADVGGYSLRVAKSLDELLALFRMRQVIFDPSKEGKENAYYEYDKYDLIADHIIIIDNEKNQICGTYRILCSNFTNDFYSECEFSMREFIDSPGVKLEFGRACVLPEYRGGAIIGLLWKGLALYIDATNADYLFGCSSVETIDPNEIALYVEYIKQAGWSEEFNVQTVGRFKCEVPQIEITDITEAKKNTPPLLRTYLTAGAKIYGPPAIDMEFECIDFLTILKMSDLKESFKNRFFR
jgi:putative hemolysin